MLLLIIFYLLAPHKTIFLDAGLDVKEYPYYDTKRNEIDFEGLISTIRVKDKSADYLFILELACTKWIYIFTSCMCS